MPEFPFPIGRLTLFIMFMCVAGTVFGQNQQISGRVVDNENDSSIEGVTVKIKGQRTGTTTNRDGAFTFSAPQNAVLVFSSIGFLNKEVPVEGNNLTTVRLISVRQSLQQVVVIGYGTAKRKDITGSISSITADQIQEVPVTTLDQAMQGRAAGVQIINNDASPGGNVTILIRGVGSLATGGNTPLYVVDGYPTTGNSNFMNPNDIASIDVLKDASATAIYGVRAANGVVIVTTKRGYTNKTKVSFDMYENFQSKPKEYKLLNAPQFAALSN